MIYNTVGEENLKKSRPKKNSWNQINQFFFREIAFLAVFPSSKIDFWPFLKWQKMEFGQNIFHEIDLFDFTSFFAWTFLNFLARCAAHDIHSMVNINFFNIHLYMIRP